MNGKDLIEKFRKGTCSIEELERLKQLLEDTNHEGLDEILESEWNTMIDDEAKDHEQLAAKRNWEKLQHTLPRSNARSNNKVRPFLVWAVAASLILSIGWFAWQQRTPPANLITMKNTSITAKEVDLPDGSKAWLNQGATLRYREQKFDRNVVLVGEAYFEIQKKMRDNFEVKANGVSIRVLGTAFNVLADSGSRETVVSLLEGKVEVNSKDKKMYLYPGDQVMINTTTGEGKVQNWAPDQVLKWKNLLESFEDKPLGQVLDFVQAHFKVIVNLEESMPGACTTSIRLYKDQTVEDVLQLLAHTHNLNLEKIGDTFLLKGTCQITQEIH